MTLFTTILLLFIAHCALTQDCHLTISSGGGFAGTETVYRVSPDGTVLKGKGLGEITFSERSKLKKSVAKKFFKRADAAIRSIESFNHPGNMYQSLAITTQDKVKKITWGDHAFPVSDEIKKIFQELSGILAKLSFTPNTKSSN